MRRHFRASISSTAAFAVCPKPPTSVHIRLPSKRSRLSVLGSPNLTQPPEAEQQSHIPSDSHTIPLLLYSSFLSHCGILHPPHSLAFLRIAPAISPASSLLHTRRLISAPLFSKPRVTKKGLVGLDAGIPRAQLTSATAIRLMSGGFSDNLGPPRAPGNN